MTKIILFLLLFLSLEIIAQEKYLIFFKDKGISKSTMLSKSSRQYQEALSLLTPRALERRAKVMDKDNLITYEDLPVKREYIAQIGNLQIKIHNKLKWFNAVSAYLTEDQVSQVKMLGFVEKAERIKVFREKKEIEKEKLISSDGLYKVQDYGPSLSQYSLSGVPTLHDLGFAGEGVIIGLLDSGFDWKDHESLADANVIAEHDFVFDDDTTANQAEDDPNQHNHGTSVFSVIGGYKDGQIISPAYKANFILAKTEDIRSERHVEEDNYAAALEWMEALGVDITSSSLGYSNGFEPDEGDYTYEDMDGKTTIVTRAAEMAFERGILIVTSAGNEGNQEFHYISAPSDGFNTISVGSVDNINVVAGFSSRGPSHDGRVKPDVAAQGVNVYCASASGFSSYSYSNGTSLSCPIVGGVAGQLLSAFPFLTNVELRRIILQSGDSFTSPDSHRGYGLVNAPLAYSVNIYLPQLLSPTLISKRFPIENGIQNGSVKIHYTIKGTTRETTLIQDEDQSFKFSISDLVQGTNVSFYYSYRVTSDSTSREPAEDKLYNFNYGDEWIKLSTYADLGYTLSNNYPNPFNYETKTKIEFTAKGGEKAELVIVDGIGQKVKMLFNGIAQPGVNEVIWDGFTDNKEPCASGVYFYFLKIAGQDFGNKMVLLK